MKANNEIRDYMWGMWRCLRACMSSDIRQLMLKREEIHYMSHYRIEVHRTLKRDTWND